MHASLSGNNLRKVSLRRKLRCLQIKCGFSTLGKGLVMFLYAIFLFYSLSVHVLKITPISN